MPNHVKNIITLKGSEKQIREMLETIKNDDYGLGTVDFNKVIPMPESLNIESGSKSNAGIKAVKEYLNSMLDEHKDKTGTYDDFFNDLRSHRNDISDEKEKEIWDIGVTAVENLHKYDAPTWYEWCINNWGTKWNSVSENGSCLFSSESTSNCASSNSISKITIFIS